MKNSKLWSIKLYNIPTETLTDNQNEILKFQQLIENMYNYKWKIINKNKNVWKLWFVMDSQMLTNLEIIYSYFMNLLIENWENTKFLSIDIINKKYLTKENLSIWLETLTNSETYINKNNLNNSIIIETLKNNWLWNLLFDLLKNLETETAIKNSYKRSCLLLKQNTIDKTEFLKQKKQLHKSYNSSLTKNTYNYTKICNRIIEIINKNFDLSILSNEITKQNTDKKEIVKQNRINRKLYKSKWLEKYVNNTKYNHRKYKKIQSDIETLTKYNKNINSDFEWLYLICKDWKYKIFKK